MKVEPKRLKLRNAQMSLDAKLEQLATAEKQLAAVQAMVQELKDQYDESTRSKEELLQTAELLQTKLERAEKLVTGLYFFVDGSSQFLIK